ncbi:MAG: parE [Rickettsiaceae bacterium]|jgi:topoisomerase-4 subunit B|nr:parE [Rickettsiaceae bacterium]
MIDLFSLNNKTTSREEYTAEDIEVLEGLEPVRRRPGMYIGGTDENALHHLISEVLDNSMDEAVAGHATRIEILMHADNSITIKDNGRGIPLDPHPKYPDKSALEVILTTLHSGGKFSSQAYKTSGGLHGVGISVVNALSDFLQVEVARNKVLHRQVYSRGHSTGPLEKIGEVANRRGTSITFHPDAEIFGNQKFKPKRIYALAKSKAYLYKGVEIRWNCDPVLLSQTPEIPQEDVIRFPGGLKDYLTSRLAELDPVIAETFTGENIVDDEGTKVEWAIGFCEGEGYTQSYCNTIPTPQGGSHEIGLRSALLKGLKTYTDLLNNKKAQNIIIDDILGSACIILSVFIRDPQFQGQTKEKLVSHGVNRIVELAIKDRFEHWLTSNKLMAEKLLEHFINVAEERLSRRQEKNVNRKTLTQKLKLPGKLADCSRETSEGTEIFIVEGDAAGGSAKKARNRETQAILPIKGKILNVANSTSDKIRLNQQISDIEVALACGSMSNYREENLRYEKVIIMTDADVDGAHIASLLMTFFFKRMPKLIEQGHLYLAKPPLYRLTQGVNTYYAGNDQEKDKMVAKLSKTSKAKIEVGRFKGLGEMNAEQLKETTMDPTKRTLIKVNVNNITDIENIVEDLMGNKPEKRYQFIHDQALNNMDMIKENLDI